MMKMYTSVNDEAVINTLLNGGVGVLRTDTIYGIVARAADERAVEELYKVRGRQPSKPCILLIANESQIFEKDLVKELQPLLSEYWPGPVSIIIPASNATPAHIHRGMQSVAYRLPANDELRQLLEHTGPLVAPSANPEGLEPAIDIDQAQRYFKDSIDFYVDGGRCDNVAPSKLLRIEPDGSLTRLR